MHVIKVEDSDKLNYKELLLLADEQMDMIEKYLYGGEMFILCDDDVKSVCIVTQEQSGVFEIKNIATDPKYQRKGYGEYLISFIVNHYKQFGRMLYVGTGNSPGILYFYERCGFVKSHIIKNFFIDNYDHPMYENREKLVDMIYLKRELS